MLSLVEPKSKQVLALVQFFSEWRLPGANTLLSLATILSFLFTQWYNLPAISSVWQPLTRRFIASVTLDAEDRLTKEVTDWVSTNVLWPRKARFWNAHTNKGEMERLREHRRVFGLSRTQPVPQTDSVYFSPEKQSTWFIFERRLFFVHIKGSYTPPAPYRGYGHEEEAIRIVCLGRTVAPIKKFLNTCRAFSRGRVESFVSVFTSSDGSWCEQSLQPTRPLETIHLDPEIKQDLLEDIQDYIDPETRRFYTDRGIPYRRGYLLYGPPGTGKTSLCMAIAGIIKLPLYILRLSSLDGDRELESQFNSLPSSCLVLMEDIDGIRLERGRKKSKSSSDSDEQPCTLSGLLNVLDGVASLEGRVVVMTANSPELLDEALTRPGRIDKKVYLGYISYDSARSMFLRIMGLVHPASSKQIEGDDGVGLKDHPPVLDRDKGSNSINDQELEKLAERFALSIPPETFTPAQVQEYLLTQRGNVQAAVERAPAWVEAEKARMLKKVIVAANDTGTQSDEEDNKEEDSS
ncbi:P-loop containing nucleoside triphosphate hydrolase protein [Stachybotrys elegans]|uniref:P-loop containing nucleoside triphosphate hydrolase protein n=1 Tax=Stachybotrys elegans TaxID=80388 RepID=A0A8K0T987_9HYPO|nr:P-loop containing nucleoside triphosphate hydrolase protein [Stachybotrys elegans]